MSPLGWLAAALYGIALAPSAAGAQEPAGVASSARSTPLTPQRTAELLAVIGRAGPQGAGSAEARAARDELAGGGLEVLPPLLGAMDTTNPVAANWYRTVYEDVVARAPAAATWPLEELHAYLEGPQHNGRARRLVLELVERLEPGFASRWMPARLEDAEFRFEAVQAALDTGEQALKARQADAAKASFRSAFEHARDGAQVARAAARLKSLGEAADVASHLGLVVDWWLIGPFDAPQKTGFSTAFPPEARVDLAASYPGQAGKPITWVRHHAADTLGQLNLNDALGSAREAVGYAWAQIDSPDEQAVQLRCGADDNCTVWLNGQQVFAREQWLNGTRFDRFITPITLRAGRNTLLVKVCQGPQHKDPEVPNNWSLQLRLCDAQGRGAPFTPVKD